MPDPVTIGGAAALGVGTSVVANKMTEAADLRAIFEQMAGNIASLVHYADVQRERTLYPINLSPGAPNYGMPGQARLEFILASGAPGDELALRIGTANLFTWISVSGDPIMIPAPVLISGDISIVDITTPAATNWRVSLFVHRDVNIGISDSRGG